MRNSSDSAIMPVFQALGVPLLSASVVLEAVIPHRYFFDRSISNLVADLIPAVQRWVLAKYGRAKYNQLEDFLNSQRRPLSELKCIVTTKVGVPPCFTLSCFCCISLGRLHSVGFSTSLQPTHVRGLR